MNMQRIVFFQGGVYRLTAICPRAFDAHHMSTLLFKMSTNTHT